MAPIGSNDLSKGSIPPSIQPIVTGPPGPPGPPGPQGPGSRYPVYSNLIRNRQPMGEIYIYIYGKSRNKIKSRNTRCLLIYICMAP